MTAATQPTVIDHVRELRGRLFISVGVFLVGATIGYLLRSQLIVFLQRPLRETLYYTSPAGSFEFIMQICGVVGLIVALPVVIFNILRFIEPALPKRLTARPLILVMASSFALAIGGAAFAYYVSLPAALFFFRTVGTSHLQALINVNQYFSFVFAYLTTFAVVFQLPLILLFIDHITPLGPGGLRKWRKLVIVGAFAFAIITPSAPDPLSQVILALPVIVLYELSLAIIWFRARKRRQVLRAAQTSPQPRPTTARPVPRRPVRLVQPSADTRRVAAAARPMRAPAAAALLDLRPIEAARLEALKLPPQNILDLRGS